MKTFTTALCALLLTLAITLPAQAATTDSDARIADVMHQLQDVITQLSYEDTLTRAQTDDLRHTLAGLYRDLDAIRSDGVVAGYPESGTGDSADDWTRYGNATLRLTPSNSKFTGWKTGNTIRVSYGANGLIYLSIYNGPYTARWTLNNAYSGTVHTTVKADASGDVHLNVTDSIGTHEFVVKAGGLGPVVTRSSTYDGGSGYPQSDYPPVVDGRTAGVWYEVYRNQVKNRVIRDSQPMTWLIQQYQDNSFVNPKLSDLGTVLGQLEGTPLSRDPIGTLRYDQNGRSFELDIPDPRRSPSDFAAFARVLYGLEQDGSTYDFDLPTL